MTTAKSKLDKSENIDYNKGYEEGYNDGCKEIYHLKFEALLKFVIGLFIGFLIMGLLWWVNSI